MGPNALASRDSTASLNILHHAAASTDSIDSAASADDVENGNMALALRTIVVFIMAVLQQVMSFHTFPFYIETSLNYIVILFHDSVECVDLGLCAAGCSMP